jgi:hypothetical protein
MTKPIAVSATICEFRYAPSIVNRDHDMAIRRHMPMLTVPLVGETVNIDGHPYKVIDRGWALGDAKDPVSYCYLRIVNLCDTDPPWLVKLAETSEWHKRYVKAWRKPEDE